MKAFNSLGNKWRIDDDGFLRVTACILKNGVFDYTAEECPAIQPNEDGIVPNKIIVDNLPEAVLQSIEGKPVIVGDHEWQTSTVNDPCGSVAGKASVVNGEILVDLLITDEATKQDIIDGKLTEISAAYDAEVKWEQGLFDGVPFLCIQTPTKFNHILLLPDGCGRCGNEVRIINKKQKDGGIMKTIKIKNGKSSKEYRFENEADAETAEAMVDDQKAFNAEEIQNAMNDLGEVKKQVEELTSKKAELEELLETYKKQLEEALSPEHQAELAEEAKQQNEDEDAVIEAEVNEAEQEATKQECQNARTYAERRALIVRKVLNSKGVKTDKFTAEAFDGAFESLVATSKAKIANKKQVMGGARVANSAASSTLERILRPMK